MIYSPPPCSLLLVAVAVSTLAAVVIFHYSSSHFRQDQPLGSLHGSEGVDGDDDDEVEHILEAICFQTLATLCTVVVGSYTAMSVWQYIGFWLGLSTLLWVSRQVQSEIVDDTYYTPVTLSRADGTDDCEQGLDEADPNERQRETRWNLNTTSSFDFVVSRYHESVRVIAQQIDRLRELPNIKSRKVRVIVYNTGEDSIDKFRAALQNALPSSLEVIVEPRKNVGREAAAYLHHILHRYDNLSDHTLFMQAEMDHPHLLQQRVKDYLIPQTGFLSLSSTQQYCSSTVNCWDHSRWGENPEILSDIYLRANPHAVATDFTLTYRGQFIASRARLLGQEKQLFDDLLDILTNLESVAHSEEYINQPWLPNKKDSLNAPLFGYTMERLREMPKYQPAINSATRRPYERWCEQYGTRPTTTDVRALKQAIHRLEPQIISKFKTALLFFGNKSALVFQRGTLLIGWIDVQEGQKQTIWYRKFEKKTSVTASRMYFERGGPEGSVYRPGGETCCEEWYPASKAVPDLEPFSDSEGGAKNAFFAACIELTKNNSPTPSSGGRTTVSRESSVNTGRSSTLGTSNDFRSSINTGPSSSLRNSISNNTRSPTAANQSSALRNSNNFRTSTVTGRSCPLSTSEEMSPNNTQRR
ncbi:hypothetical protein E4T47_02221 [Aureobasidium subglaciale]|nr:hypothetical protein E4T47_02221 [Aureobasidium subglaciale]